MIARASLAKIGALAAALALAGGVTFLPARAEQLVTTLSSELVSISSNFTGSEIVFFGSIERDAQSVSRPADYEIVIEVKGPPANVVTREKQRTLGLWINRASESYDLVPAFYAVLASAPPEAIAGDGVRAPLGIGFDMVPLRREAGPTRPFRSAFEKAFLRLMQAQGRYAEIDDAVTFLTPTLFKASLVLPANVPIGSYDATIHLFRDGVKLADAGQRIEVAKVGFEQLATQFARQHGYLYGLATVLMATFTGWLAGIIFRRD
ncbi:TIGR02186 family protein [Methylobrevis pamukkalensis]|uniref:Putative transmembrane protein n=1 Tax=Methylobrevis pamukkalensis TaxID=1439726 RepID=A0A1E3GYH6_9HYPH|nr:TIGR02186 family protein [Methylobrevis pamukkalensis]ODN69118.1 putative transmembrane protein [Methylobrevis pamukkalensis]